MIICIDVRCPSGHVHEVFLPKEQATVTCPQEGCNEVAERIISPVRTRLDPRDSGFPGARMKWQKQREERMKIERKAVENHGPGADWDVARR